MEGGGAYLNPGAMEIGLVEAGDDLLDEVTSGTETASLSQQQGGFGIAQGRSHVQDRF